MAKQSGLGDHLLVAGRLIGGDVQQLGTIGGGPAPLEVTDITQSAMARIGGVRDGNIEYTAYFNPSPGRSHEYLSTLPTAHQLATYLRGVGLGRPAACLVGKQLDYAGTRADDGGFTFATQAQNAQFGLEWCEQLTDGVRTDSAATDGPSLDLGTGPTAYGLQAYLHVMAFTGTDATVTLQQSSDDGAGDAWTDVAGGAFTAVTDAPGWQRIETARDLTVERYLRVSTSGTFSDLQFAVLVNRNPVETRF